MITNCYSSNERWTEKRTPSTKIMLPSTNIISPILLFLRDGNTIRERRAVKSKVSKLLLYTILKLLLVLLLLCR